VPAFFSVTNRHTPLSSRIFLMILILFVAAT
jgi:hypothetical protein